MKINSPIDSNTHRFQAWLARVGFQLDPFISLEASSDPYLSSYLVNHDAFLKIWGNWPNLVFAPAGGGKTAMRVRTTQACFIGQETNCPFPLNYSLPLTKWVGKIPDYESHLSHIIMNGTQFLVLLLIYRPHWYFQLPEASQRYLLECIHWNLPVSLMNYLKPYKETGNINLLRDRFQIATLPKEISDETDSYNLVNILNSKTYNESRPPIKERWGVLVDVLLNTLQFSSVYLLIDGLDAAPDTAKASEMNIGCIDNLITEIDLFASSHIYQKYFLPAVMQETLHLRYSQLLTTITSTKLEWSPTLLADVARFRIQFASNGAYDSLDLFTSPAVREIEKQLSEAIIPLPREMLVIMRQLLVLLSEKSPANPKIHPEDVSRVTRWYRDNQLALFS